MDDDNERGWFTVPEPVIGDDSYRSMWVMLHG